MICLTRAWSLLAEVRDTLRVIVDSGATVSMVGLSTAEYSQSKLSQFLGYDAAQVIQDAPQTTLTFGDNEPR
eukprot:6365910-Alexandrium_andersonii.AAC.1